MDKGGFATPKAMCKPCFGRLKHPYGYDLSGVMTYTLINDEKDDLNTKFIEVLYKGFATSLVNINVICISPARHPESGVAA